jgi:hypothetical protein
MVQNSILIKMKMKKLFMRCVVAREPVIRLSTTILSLCPLYATIIAALAIYGCEGNDKFFRPNLPEKLCSIGIIDADDTTNYRFSLHDILDIRNSRRYISFEKSFQSEYSEEVNNSLKELSFKIYSDNEEIFDYHNNNTIGNRFAYELPDNLVFNSGKSYSLVAKEKDLPEISAMVAVPEPPSKLSLISINKEIVAFNDPSECNRVSGIAYAAALKISFSKKNVQNQYYALLVDAKGVVYQLLPPILYTGPIEFTIRESNTQGFFAEIHGLSTFRKICKDGESILEIYSPPVYFIAGDEIPDSECKITLSVQYHDTRSPLYTIGWLRVKLLSIPKELYLFEKSLYIYRKVKEDPFAEPIYLNGNIKGGNGVFAVCRSTSLKLDLQWY